MFFPAIHTLLLFCQPKAVGSLRLSRPGRALRMTPSQTYWPSSTTIAFQNTGPPLKSSPVPPTAVPESLPV